LQTSVTKVAALSNQPVALFLRPGCARDGTTSSPTTSCKENAGPDEFRTAPLWGLGQRIFLLHDGRTTDLGQAIQEHASRGTLQFAPSEANRVIENFEHLGNAAQQDLLNFLRSL